MADLFQGKDHARVYSQSRQSTPQVLVDRVLSFLKEKYDGKLTLAVDVGCGSGQNTFSYANAFERVIGTDVSAAQINEAVARNDKANVTFQVAPSHQIPCEDGSVQLLTAATAAHWFDLPKFFAEGERVLCPGGVMALYSYNMFPKLALAGVADNEKSERINDMIRKIYFETLQEYWNFEKAKLVVDCYRGISIPLRDLTREYDFLNDYQMTLSSVISRLESSSGFQTFSKVKGKEAGDAVVQSLLQEVYETLGENCEKSPEKILLNAQDSHFLVIARNERLEGCWDVKLSIRTLYQEIVIPMRDFIREDGFVHEFRMTLESVVARLRSSSGFQKYCTAQGPEEGDRIVQELLNEVYDCLGEDANKDKPLETVEFRASSSMFLVMARN